MKHIVNTPMYTQSDSSISNRVIGARIQNSNNIIIILKSMNLHPVPSEKFQTWSTSGSRFRYLESWLRTLHLFIFSSLHLFIFKLCPSFRFLSFWPFLVLFCPGLLICLLIHVLTSTSFISLVQCCVCCQHLNRKRGGSSEEVYGQSFGNRVPA